MAVAQRITREVFAFRFRRAFDAKKKREEAEGRVYGLLTCARNVDPESPGRTRRSLQRYHNAGAHLPNIRMRRALAIELEVPLAEFGAADDEEDPHIGQPDSDRALDQDLLVLAQLRAVKRQVRELERLVEMTTEGAAR